MLKPVPKRTVRAIGASFAIVASEYNARYVDSMVRAAKAELARGGATKISVLRVPGAYEIPLVASCLAGTEPGTPARDDTSSSGRPSRTSRSRGGAQIRPEAIICLGVVLRGETAHAAHIGEAVSRALMVIQLRSGVPVIHEVLLLENKEQAEARCMGSTHNRGREAARTALAMAELMRRLRGPGGIGSD